MEKRREKANACDLCGKKEVISMDTHQFKQYMDFLCYVQTIDTSLCTYHQKLG